MARNGSVTTKVVGVGRGSAKSNGSGNPKRLAPLANNTGGGSTKPLQAPMKVAGK